MPKPKPNESRNSYMSRCVPILMAENLSNKEAVNKCYHMYSTYTSKQPPKRKRKRIARK